MSDTDTTDDLSSDEAETPLTEDVFDAVEEVTVWAPEPGHQRVQSVHREADTFP